MNVTLTFSALRANSAGRQIDIVLFFSLKTGFDISWKYASGDNMLEMLKPVFWGEK